MIDINWDRIKHWNYGGVTDGQFWFGWKGDFETQTMSFHHTRHLIHILSSSAKSFQVEVDCPYNI